MSETTNDPGATEQHIDEDKLEAWDQVKGDYQVEPDGEPVPNSMDSPDVGPVEDEGDALTDR